jgi:hypothetical protein
VRLPQVTDHVQDELLVSGDDIRGPHPPGGPSAPR